jgi:hypothetical protein
MAPLLRRASAWTALLGFVVAIGLGRMVVGHTGPDDDAACVPVAVAAGHSHSTTQFEAPRNAPATHCPFCHWQRAVGGSTTLTLQANTFALEPVEWALPAGSSLPRSAALDAHLSRGPPTIA